MCTHMQPPMHQPTEGTDAWQVQQSRRRRRLQTDPGVPSSHEVSTEYHIASHLRPGGGQHQQVDRVRSEPTYYAGESQPSMVSV